MNIDQTYPNFELLSGHLSVSDIVQASLNSNSQLTDYSLKHNVPYYQLHTKPPSSRAGPIKRSSRALRRQNQDSLKDNPYAILLPEDLIPPGYTFDMPKFHFKPQHFEPSFISFDLTTKKKQKTRPRIDFSNRKELKKNHYAQKVLPKLETELRDFLSIFREPSTNFNTDNSSSIQETLSNLDVPREIDDSWDYINTEGVVGIKVDYELDLDAMLVSAPRVESFSPESDAKILICSLANPFHRYIMHVLCEYYNLVSYSRDDSRGYPSVVVCQPGVSTNHKLELLRTSWSYPPRLMYDEIFSKQC